MSNYYFIVKTTFEFSPPEVSSELAYDLKKLILLSFRHLVFVAQQCFEAK